MANKNKRRTAAKKTNKPKANLSSAERQGLLKLLAQAANALQGGQLDAAKQLYHTVLAKDPYNAEALEQCGLIAFKHGDNKRAIGLISKAIEFDPKRPRACYMLGFILSTLHQYDQAIAAYQQCVALDPRLIEAHNNLGVIFKNLERYDEAKDSFQTVVNLNPRSGYALSNLGNVLKDSGQMSEAVKVLQRATIAEPKLSAAYSNLLVALNYLNEFTAQDVFARHCQWGQHVPDSIQSRRFSFDQLDPSPTRPLRIGYLSPDFHTHSVAFFIEPVLRQHSADNVEVYGYYNNTIFDDTYQRLKSFCIKWRDVESYSELQLADTIYQDQIDILIDLTGHMADNRLAVFYQKPAPVQVTWLGYPNTTGLSEIDYRLSDAIADPLEPSAAFHSEKLQHLTPGFLCYEGDTQLPAAQDSPALNTGYITFGSFNNIVKITQEVIACWASILKAVPNSKLLLKSRQLADPSTSAGLLAAFEQHGIAASRLRIYGLVPDIAAHMALYAEVDIALDPFPYNGTTTTCEALWMGVPVIALLGEVHAGRVTASILHRLELDDYVASSVADYVDLAIRKAADITKLNALRLQLRQRMLKSSLCDSSAFTASLEQTYREMWLSYLA